MMRFASFVLVSLLLSAVLMRGGDGANQPQEASNPPTNHEERRAMIERLTANVKKERKNAPKTLAEAHERLEQTLPAETLAEIDAMESEEGMIKYHFGLGLNIRNGWGLWGDSPLAQHMRELGFTHADDMSGAILNTFWCKRHGQDFRLEERAAHFRRYWGDRSGSGQGSRAEIRKMMMRLRFEQRDVPVVPIVVRRGGANVRFSCPFRGGVFFTIYGQGSIPSSCYAMEGYDVDRASGLKPEYDDAVARGLCSDPTTGELRKMKPGEDFYTQGCYLDPADGKAHPIQVPGVQTVYAAVVAGDRAWLAGLTDGKAVLAGVGDHDRIVVPLPQEDEIPDLGLDGQSLLAVYSKKVYCLEGRTWTVVHSADILLPRSGLPPQRYGNKIFLRDEGGNGNRNRLWWLVMGEKPCLRLLVRDIGLFGADSFLGPGGWHDVRYVAPPGWEETSSYDVTGDGNVWACVANGAFVFRRSQDGTYSYAIADRSVSLAGDSSASEEADQRLSVSGVRALSDNSLLLVGYRGLYRLRGNELIQELAFAPQDSRGEAVGRWSWNPNNVLALDDGSYFISTGSWRGTYLLRKADGGRWTCQTVDEGDPVVW